MSKHDTYIFAKYTRVQAKVGGRCVIGIPEEIYRVLGKKENVDIWLEGDKIVAEIY